MTPVDKLLVRLDQHEPSAACHDVHCFAHNVDEPGPGYLGCQECFHLYRTPRDLRRAHRANCRQAIHKEWWTTEPFWAVLRAWISCRWHLLTVRAKDIYFCPECGHDF